MFGERARGVGVCGACADGSWPAFCREVFSDFYTWGSGLSGTLQGFTVDFYEKYREEKDDSCKSCKRQFIDYARVMEIRAVGLCVCKACGGESDTTKDKDVTPENRASTTFHSVDKGCL
jgi:hypothetical protein